MAIISNCTVSIIKDAALALKQGHLVAFPTETVYGLGADATNEKAVARIYEVKGRPTDHPLIVHISSLELLDKWARDIPEYAIKLARNFWPGPMTLVLQRTPIAKDFITGGQDTVAIRVPVHTLARQFLMEFESLGGYGVAAPSANRFGKVSPTTATAVKLDIGESLSSFDHILDGGPSQIGVESTIIDCSRRLPVILRPGSVSIEMLQDLIKVNLGSVSSVKNKIKVPGMLTSHYRPNAKVFFAGTSSIGDGFLALASIPTPAGAIRLAAPIDNSQYAYLLYETLRLADKMGLRRVCVVKPNDEGIGKAINDRLAKIIG